MFILHPFIRTRRNNTARSVRVRLTVALSVRKKKAGLFSMKKVSKYLLWKKTSLCYVKMNIALLKHFYDFIQLVCFYDTALTP